MTDLRLRNGTWWPESDTQCREAIDDEVAKVASIVQLCRGLEVAVQAGANVGLVPKELAKHFARVICFEPDPDNAAAAQRNLEGTHVELYLAALGGKFGRVGINRIADNCGASQTVSDGIIPVLTVDMLYLRQCHLLMLDIEGDEYDALFGARETIRKYRPVVVIEDKSLKRAAGEPGRLMFDMHDYRQVNRLGHDLVMRPAEHVRKAA